MDMLTLLTMLVAMSMLLVAGILLPFSDFVFRGFSQIPAMMTVKAMQSINKTVLSSIFIVLFMANVAASLLLVLLYALKFGLADSYLVVAAAVLYIVGVVMVTGRLNVPLNEKLRLSSPADESAAKQLWQSYARPWARWNNLRVTLGIAAAFCLFITAVTTT